MAVLSKRMEALYHMAGSGEVLADVGCDHGFLSIALCKDHRFSSAVAMDVREGPLSRAREHIAAAGLSQRIDCRLSDGLFALEEKEADVILIAGMGGALMQRILIEGGSKAKQAKTLVLQPQSQIREFRYFLQEQGYVFLDEDAVFEDGKYYFLMQTASREALGERDCITYHSEAEFAFGGCLMKKQHPVLLEYVEHEKAICKETLFKLEQSNSTPAVKSRKQEITDILKLLSEVG
ncbi:MAG: class I SAM-dependent methyltransferase [Lachnospiraceae bacterium]|nr:class I SAM-dependent methyltransferase [Lachnospiraceae bacterium]